MDIVTKAEEFATRKHEGQKRDGGEPFIVHPAQTAAILSQVTDDPELIAAGWLHDTLEDTQTTYDELRSEFGQRVADLVNEATQETDDKGQHYFPRLQSREGAMLKFADRLSNLSSMQVWNEERQQTYLRRSTFWPSEAEE